MEGDIFFTCMYKSVDTDLPQYTLVYLHAHLCKNQTSSI